MKRIIVTSSILALAGSAAMAGGYTTPAPAPEVTPAPVAVAPAQFSWDGFYAGAQLGYGKADQSIDGDGVVGGLHAGYLRDFGGYVLGGELAYNAANIDDNTTGAKVNSMTDLKMIAGAPYNNMLFYGTLGASYVDAEDNSGASYSDTVPLVGVGMKYAINPKWTVGTELDYRKGNNFDGTTNDLNTTTLNLTASYKF
ncbi:MULTISPECIES: outer membrane beta-barrel protein [unclassified Thioclava]|uniref:outer membrane protein n=1 Tax=unclassified Thioclava TaxID=2621713 RepID=UPI001304B4F0|nr:MULTISPECIES: outer membrane beta-barrel protein [unclassified Thioclava]